MENYNDILKLIQRNRCICFFCGKKHLIKKIYREKTGQNINFSSISTFREKLQLRKLYNHPLISQCANKNLVRSYVSSKIGSQYLIPQFFCKPKIFPADLKDLPNSFILKTTNGSGTNIVVRDKTKNNFTKICNEMNRYAKIRYGYLWGEFFYNRTRDKIIAEKLITTKTVYDYKIHCFRDNDKKLRQIIEVLWGPKDNRHKRMYDSHWQPLPYYFSIPPSKTNFKKPDQLQELLRLSSKLSENFSYVRVDFYIINNRIYFGELTFVPTAGFNGFMPSKYDQIWGRWISDQIILKPE